MAKTTNPTHNLGVSPAQIGFIALGSLVLGALTASSSVASIARNENPALALRFAPWDSGANAAAADEIIKQNNDKRHGTIAATHARAAIARSPLAPVAARTLGFVEEGRGHRQAGRALILQAAMLSRRDLATRLWLIEDAVARNDISGALEQYDIAMRPSHLARQILFPVLTEALTDPRMVDPVIRLFAKRPNWAGEFIQTALATGKASENLARIVVRSPQISAPDADLRQQALQQLVRERKYGAARRLHAALKPGQSDLVVDPRFGASNELAPFAWTLSNAGTFGAERNNGLRLYADSSAGGVAATQLLTLSPGLYKLISTGFTQSADRFGGAEWTVLCAEDGGSTLVTNRLPGEMKTVTAEFTVAAACQAQWLQLAILPSEAPQGVEGTIREVRIARVSD